jgi:hypothetical protein
MKEVVREELETEGFSVVEEPLFPPVDWISWSTYRPDLMGLRVKEPTEEVAIVECETLPSMRRLFAKNYGSLWFQPPLMREGSIRRILAVPRGKLCSLDLRLRHGWEIWIRGRDGPTEKIAALRG